MVLFLFADTDVHTCWHTHTKHLLWPTLSTSFMDLVLHTPPIVLSSPCRDPAEVADIQRERRTLTFYFSCNHHNYRYLRNARSHYDLCRHLSQLPNVASQARECRCYLQCIDNHKRINNQTTDPVLGLHQMLIID